MSTFSQTLSVAYLLQVNIKILKRFLSTNLPGCPLVHASDITRGAGRRKQSGPQHPQLLEGTMPAKQSWPFALPLSYLEITSFPVRWSFRKQQRDFPMLVPQVPGSTPACESLRRVWRSSKCHAHLEAWTDLRPQVPSASFDWPKGHGNDRGMVRRKPPYTC